MTSEFVVTLSSVVLVQVECPRLKMLGAGNASDCMYILDLGSMYIFLVRYLGDRTQT